jgi:pimeloyl-ACP methyl ester carboxylesterase
MPARKPNVTTNPTKAPPSSGPHWFDRCGHFPMWDRPAETVDVVLRATG